MKIVIYGLTITSSWGNGHATTYRSLSRALARKGHTIHFVEKDVEWYRNNRDLPQPDFCQVHLYEDWLREGRELIALASDADVVLVGSYFPDAIAASRALFNAGYGPVLFYDIDTPITMAQLREHGRTTYLEPSLIPLYDAYLSFTGGPALAELEEEFDAAWAVPFYCSVDADMYRPVAASPEFQCDLSYLGTYAADRQPKLMQFLNDPARLLPDRRFLVAGPQYPSGDSVAFERPPHDSSVAARAPVLLFVLPFLFELDPCRHGRCRLFSFGAALRSLRVRSDDSLRSLAGTRAVPASGRGDHIAARCARGRRHSHRHDGRTAPPHRQPSSRTDPVAAHLRAPRRSIRRDRRHMLHGQSLSDSRQVREGVNAQVRPRSCQFFKWINARRYRDH